MLGRTILRILAMLTLAAVAGCANPGLPRAPSLHLPKPAERFAAERVGDRVLFSWTTAPDSTDGGALAGPIDAVLCIDGPMGATKPAPCRPLLRVRTAPGPGQAALALTPEELRPPARLLAYRLELENAKGRSAGLSAVALAASGPAPPPVGALTVTARPEGALITWARTPSPAAMELRRSNAAPAAPQKPASRRQPAFGKTAAEVVLRAETEPAGEDTADLLDRGLREPALDGVPVTYVAQRTEEVTLDGHRLTLRGEASAPVSFTFRDIFPPTPPAGLQAVAEHHPPAIDLSWDAGTDPGLAGYNLYRAPAAGGDFVRLNPGPLQAPAYRDLTALPATGYRYRVTAIDGHGNESSAGPEVSERIPQP